MAIGSGYYRPLVEEFARRGWEARSLPRRGFERNSPAASKLNDWAYRDEIEDLAAAVARARSESPTRPVLVLGHSLGGQIAAGHDLTHPPVDGLVTVGAALPRPVDYPLRGLPLLLMGRVIVPALTGIFGYLPKPAFGAPGARTLMREWSRMVVTGRVPFSTSGQIDTPALIVSLQGDTLAPARSVNHFTQRLFSPGAVTRWHYRHDEVRPGTSNDHITWVRSSALVVDRVVDWWSTQNGQTRCA